MENYDFIQLVFYFYVYGFFGWVYESILVSIRTKRPTNRGFVKGPILPIYGLGATTILFMTGPFIKYPVVVFFVGMISATILEYFSGYILEKLFKVRYWDYTGYFGNIKGYICLVSVLIWGLFSDLTVYFIHRPVEALIKNIPDILFLPLVSVITVVFVVDLVKSFKKAYDFKTLVINAEKLYDNIKNIEEQLNFDEKKEELMDLIEKYKNEAYDNISRMLSLRDNLKKYNPKLRISKKHKNILDEIKTHINDKKKPNS